MTGSTAPTPAGDPPRVEWLVLQGRCRHEDLRLVDVAAALEGKPRGHFAVESAVAAARRVLEEHGVPWPVEVAA